MPFGKHGYISNWIVFRRKLAGIVADLGPLAEQHALMKFLRNVDHANVLNGFVKDVVYAITDYQVWDEGSITGTV